MYIKASSHPHDASQMCINALYTQRDVKMDSDTADFPSSCV